MTVRDQLHALIDSLTEEECRVLDGIIRYERAQMARGRLHTLADAPIDDEEETPEEAAAVAEAKAEIARGERIPFEEVARELGL